MKKTQLTASSLAVKRNFLRKLAAGFPGTDGASRNVKFANPKMSFSNMKAFTTGYS